jgi:hypothetical protein
MPIPIDGSNDEDVKENQGKLAKKLAPNKKPPTK